MEIEVSAYASKKFRKLASKDFRLSKLVDKKLNLLIKNPRYPALRLHKLSDNEDSEWSISIKGNLRILFTYTKNGIIITDIGSHDEVY